MATRTLFSSARKAQVSVPALTPEDVASLKDMGILLDGDLAWLTRVLSNRNWRPLSEKKDIFSRPPREPLATLNKRRRAARAFLVGLFQGKVAEGYCRDLRNVWLPELLGRNKWGEMDRERALAFLEYSMGLLAGALHLEARENLVPMARIQAALEHAFQRMLFAI